MKNAINGSRPLSQRLEEPEVVAAINRLLDRIDVLENTVDTLNRVVREGPGFIAMATDIADETVHQAELRGIGIEHRIKNGLAIAEKITEDQTADSISKAMDLAQEAPGFVAMIADMFDEEIRKSAQNGIDLDARLKGVLQLAKQLTEPDTLSSIQSGLALLSEAPGFVAMISDMLDEQIHQAAQNGVDVDQRIKGLLSLLSKTTDPATTAALGCVMEAKAVERVGALGRALANVDTIDINSVGPMGLMKHLRDPEVKRATGFLISVAKALGKELNT